MKNANKKFAGYPKPVEMDKIHYNFRRLDSTGKKWRMVISAREAGKTTSAMIQKVWRSFRIGRTTLFVVRKMADLTEAAILSLQFILNKFVDNGIEFEYNKSEIKNGFILVYAKLNGQKDLIFAILALSMPVNRIKRLILPNIGQAIFDEYVINPKWKESYLPGEADKLKEVYKTFEREYRTESGEQGIMPFYIMGNPYSLYNPMVDDWKVDYNKLFPGAFIIGENYVIENYELCDELVEQIKKKNPEFNKNDAYTNYALNGIAVNDLNIRIGKLQNGFLLKYVVKFGENQIGIFKNVANDDFNAETRYYCGVINYENLNRNVYCFDFNDLTTGSILYSKRDEVEFVSLKCALRRNQVIFDNVGTYYKIINVYAYL